MNSRINLRLSLQDARRYLLLAFAFALPIALGVAEFFLFLVLAFSIALALKGANAFQYRLSLALPAALYVVSVLISICLGNRPEAGLAKLHRLLFLSLMFVVPSVFSGKNGVGVMRVVGAFVLGCALNAIYDVVRIGSTIARGGNLYDAGSMTTPQFYMVAICLLAAIGVRKTKPGPGFDIWRYYVFQTLNAAGLVLHFKRGVWLATSFTVAAMLILKKRFLPLVLLAAIVAILALAPQVRHRVAQLPEEFAAEQGGRWVLWTKVAPALIAANPGGVGWQALRQENLAGHAEYVQPHLDHLHNNILQITAELGWLGGAVWVLWMLSLLCFMVGSTLRLYRTDARRGRIALGSLAAFVALLLNGMVENNFDDSEIMLLYFLLTGISATVALRYSPLPSE